MSWFWPVSALSWQEQTECYWIRGLRILSLSLWIKFLLHMQTCSGIPPPEAGHLSGLRAQHKCRQKVPRVGSDPDSETQPSRRVTPKSARSDSLHANKTPLCESLHTSNPIFINILQFPTLFYKKFYLKTFFLISILDCFSWNYFQEIKILIWECAP